MGPTLPECVIALYNVVVASHIVSSPHAQCKVCYRTASVIAFLHNVVRHICRRYETKVSAEAIG